MSDDISTKNYSFLRIVLMTRTTTTYWRTKELRPRPIVFAHTADPFTRMVQRHTASISQHPM